MLLNEAVVNGSINVVSVGPRKGAPEDGVSRSTTRFGTHACSDHCVKICFKDTVLSDVSRAVQKRVVL
jgi:hypothetical protein